MPTFTLTPIPYSGGTLNWTDKEVNLTRLNNTRYVYAFSQSGPGYKFYGIADVSNITTTPSVTVIKQRAFIGEFSSVLLVPLDNNRFVSYDGADLYVYNTSTNDVVEELKIANYGNDFGNDPADRVSAVKIADDVILEAAYVPSTTPGQYRLDLRKLTYDTGTSTMSISIPITVQDNLGFSFNEIYVDIKPVLGDPNKWAVVFARIGDWTSISVIIQKIVIYDSSTHTIDDITPASIPSDFTGGNIIAFSPTAIVLFGHRNQQAMEYDGTSWSSPFNYASDDLTAYVVKTIAFSPSYGILIRKPAGYSANQWFMRVVNYQGPGNIVTSFPTNVDAGVLVDLPTNFKTFSNVNNFVDLYDPETFLLNGYNNNATDKQFMVLRFKP